MVTAAAVASQVGNASSVGNQLGVDPAMLLNSAIILVAAYVVGRGLSTGLRALADRYLANRFRITLLIPLLKFIVYGGAVYVVLSLLFDLTSTQILAFSSLLGAALGLGLKDLLADVVGGLVLVAEQPYQIGDKVQIGDYYGEVTNIGIRSTQVLTPNDTLVSVPNYLFFNEAVANANAGQAEMLVTVEFYIDPGSDARAAREIVEDALVSSQYVYITEEYPVEVHLADDLHYRTITGKAYVNDLRNELRFKTDVTDRVFEEFSRRGIESPRAAPDPVGAASE